MLRRIFVWIFINGRNFDVIGFDWNVIGVNQCLRDRDYDGLKWCRLRHSTSLDCTWRTRHQSKRGSEGGGWNGTAPAMRSPSRGGCPRTADMWAGIRRRRGAQAQTRVGSKECGDSAQRSGGYEREDEGARRGQRGACAAAACTRRGWLRDDVREGGVANEGDVRWHGRKKDTRKTRPKRE
ncbi:hypothetical protein B0H16DRAFT_1473152 [Mycena metata]|uniref:Uncharacterized protein n=1 Tax=Mycena metata TaxID=1033252 RepID=A0AAD7HKI0_9AGAR|nr:hypothetical protein B0H16DRAFT_1473152 [Mycena metata]